MTNNDRIAAKVRKLFALAERNGNPHEAARAIEKARALLRAHGLDAAEVRATGEGEGEAAGMTEAERSPSGKTVPQWQAQLAHAAAELCEAGCYASTTTTRGQWGEALSRETVLRFYGAPLDVQAALATFDALSGALAAAVRHEKNRADYALARSRRAWLNSFRLGYAVRVRQMARETVRAEAAAAPSPEGQAWALVVAGKRDRLDAQRERLGIRTRSRRAAPSAAEGYLSGAQAAERSNAVARVAGQLPGGAGR